MDTLFLIASKTGWFFLRPETILVLLLAVPLLLLWRDRVTAAKRTLAFALCLTLLIGFFPIGNLLLNPLERAFPVHPAIASPQGIIVLGGMEHVAPDDVGGFAQLNEAAERLTSTLELANRFPDATVLFSGGKVALRPVDTGEFNVGPDILRQIGLPDDRLIVEGRSRTTAENATRAKASVAGAGEGPWVLVTSAWHMPRAYGSFCAAGWTNVIPYPVDYRGGPVLGGLRWSFADNLSALNVAVKEWIGLVAYRLTGRTTTVFPLDCR